MSFDVVFVGGGLGSIFSLYNLIRTADKKNLNICIIDKEISNIPGGVAYGNKLENIGFFNNPCRLSPKELIRWVYKNKVDLINFVENSNSNSFKEWVKRYKLKFLNSKSLKDLDEIYLPRIFCNFWLESLLIKSLKKIKKKNYKILFIQGEAKQIIKKKKYKILIKNPTIFNCDLKQGTIGNQINFIRRIDGQNIEYINAKNILISLGIPEPRQSISKKILSDKFYIHDLYVSGGTKKLIKLINKKKLQKKNVSIHFLGSKAGFLEALPELYFFSKKNNIKIISTSNNAETLNSADISKNNSKYKLNFFSKNNYKKIKNPDDLYKKILEEFSFAESNNYNKYDPWTIILRKNILTKIIKNFDEKDKEIYNNKYFQLIRSKTRFTFPLTVKYKNLLEKYKIIKMIKSSVKSVSQKKDEFIVETKNNKKIKSDILVCVFGPQSVMDLKINDSLFKSLHKLKIEFLNTGIKVNKYFQTVGQNNIYMIGFHANGYNPDRKTIIKAIVENSKFALKSLKNNIVN
ncbi:MAG: hypothetical protein CBC82_07505 [Cellvibrionales bacterium TMED122]|nr:MAG: hypothetical protein CBC82_07505 [Cellvibrionales bacterium TMED122]